MNAYVDRAGTSALTNLNGQVKSKNAHSSLDHYSSQMPAISSPYKT